MSVISFSAQSQDNPLLSQWSTPYATPPLSAIQNSHYEPAIRAAIKEAKDNIDKIVKQKSPATFDNTVLALEYADTLLQRISAVMFNLNECNTDAGLQELVLKLSPEITRFDNSVWMNERLYARIKELYDKRDALGLTEEQTTLLENCHKHFVRNGIGLAGKDKKRFAANSEELSKLTQQFNSNVLADNNSYTLHITDRARLRGVPERDMEEARAEATRRGKEGWVFTLQRPSYTAMTTYCDDRSLREQMWRAYNSRGNHAGSHYNGDIIRRITQLRMEQAKMLGYDTYADYVLDDRMAHDRQTLANFMKELIESSFPVARQDMAALQQFAMRTDDDITLQPWDIAYYAEKLRQKLYNFDEEQLRPYFQLEKVRQGIFDLYGKLYGLTFKQNNTVEVYHPDVRVFEVWDGSRLMGLLYLDMFPRDGKRSGAWMTEFRGQYRKGGTEVRPLIQVVCNFTRPVGDTPSLLSLDEVRTFMHEMGHAMHGMLSDVNYESLSGTNVKRDFGELPSQLMENWCDEPQFLQGFASHWQTGATMSAEYITRIRKSRNFMAGYYCVRQLGFASIDMAYHSLTEPLAADIELFEKQNSINMLPTYDGCCTSTAFTHIFAGGGYAAGYYGYKWAEVLDADVFSKFKKEGLFNTATASQLRSTILSKGGTRHPAQLFKDFMGREPNIEAYLLRSGFIKEATFDTGMPR